MLLPVQLVMLPAAGQSPTAVIRQPLLTQGCLPLSEVSATPPSPKSPPPPPMNFWWPWLPTETIPPPVLLTLLPLPALLPGQLTPPLTRLPTPGLSVRTPEQIPALTQDCLLLMLLKIPRPPQGLFRLQPQPHQGRLQLSGHSSNLDLQHLLQ